MCPESRATVRLDVGRVEVLAPWIAGVLLAAPILLVRYPPMGDLAMHEALVSIMRHRGDPHWAPADMYSVVAPQANQLFPFLAYALSFVVPTDVACKLVVAVTVAGSVVAMSRLLAHLGRSRWPSLLVAPVVCGWTFRWGLVANLLGLVLLLAFLPSLETLARRPSVGNVARAIGAAGMLWFAHESSALIFAALAVYFGVRARSAISFAVRVLPALAAVGLATVQWFVSRALAGANMHAIGNAFGPDPVERLSMLPGAVFGGMDGARLAVLGGAWLVVLLLMVSGRRRPGPPDDLPLRAALWRHRYAVSSGLLLLLFLSFPMTLGGTTLLAHRFLPVACVCAVVACAPRRASPLHVAAAVLVPLVLLATEAKSFRESDRLYRDLDVVLALVPNDVAVAQLDLTPRDSGRVAPVPGAASRVQAEHGGRMLFAMTDMPPNPVYVRPDLRWNEPVLRMAHSPFAFMPAYDATRFAYLLTLNRNQKIRTIVRKALEPEERLVASSGDWDLYQSTLPTVPLDSPDGRPPRPLPETLAARVSRMAQSPPRGR